MRSRTVSKFGKQALSLLLVVMMLTAQFAGVLPAYAEETLPEGGTTIGDDGDTGVSGSGTGAGGSNTSNSGTGGDVSGGGDEQNQDTQTWTVTFVYNDGTDAKKETTVTNGETVSALDPAPTRNGYTLDGWYKVTNDETGETEAEKYVFATGVTADITLKAKWTWDEYTVTFMNGDTKVEQMTGKHYGDEVTAPEVAAKTGYVFKGWKNGANTYQAGAAITVTGAATFTADWKETVEVTLDYGYELEGGTTKKVVSIEKDTDFHSSKWAEPTRDGYDFKGWLLGDGAYTATSVTASITLKAQWEAATYAVTLNTNVKDANEATLTGDNTDITEYTFNMENSVKLPSAERSNYTFEGWLDSKGNKVTEIAARTCGNQTYTAQWTGVDIDVTLDYGYKANSDDSENVKKTVKAEYGKAYAKPTDPERTGYEFDKWVDSEDAEYDFEKIVTAPFTLKATWKLKTDGNYTVKAGGEPLANNGWTNKTNVVITPNTGLQISVKTGETEWTGYADSYSVPVEEECGYTVTFKLKDGTGLESAVGTASFNYDKTPVDVSFEVAKDNGGETRIAGSDATGWRSSQGFIVTVSAEAGENGSPLVDNWQSTVKAILIDESIENDDGIEVKIDNAGQVFLAPKQGTEGQLESGHKYVLKISGTMDKAGNGVTNGEAVSATLEYDGSQPVVTVSAESDYTNESGKNFFKDSYAVDINVTEKDLTGAENGAIPKEVTITLDNGEVTAVTGGSYDSVTQVWSAKLTVSGDNAEHTVTVKVDDGVHTKDNFYTATIDSVAPLFDTETDKVNKTVVAAGAAHEQEFAVKYTDNLSGVDTKTIAYTIEALEGESYDVDDLTITGGADGICTEETLTIAAKDGTAFKGTITFTAKDNVKNESIETTYDVNVDNLAPEVEIGEITGDTGYDEESGKYYSSNNVKVELKVKDDNFDGNLVTVKVNGKGQTLTGTWEKGKDGFYTNSITIPKTTEGEYTISLEAEDKAENKSSEPATVSVVIDTTDPELTIGEPDHIVGDKEDNTTFYTNTDEAVCFELTVKEHNLGSADNITVTLTKDDEEVNAEAYELETWQQSEVDEDVWTSKLTVPAGEDNEGVYVVTLTAKDQANNNSGNKKATASKTLVIDRTAPNVNFTYSGNEFGEDRYANAKGEVGNDESIYCVFTASETDDLSVTVTITDANIDLIENNDGNSEGIIKIYRFDTLEEASEPNFTDMDPVKTVNDGWELKSEKWTRTVAIEDSDDEGYYVAVVSAKDKATNVPEDEIAGSVLVNDLTAPSVEETETTGVVAWGPEEGQPQEKAYYYGVDLNATFTVSDGNEIVGNNINVTVKKCTVDGAEGDTVSPETHEGLYSVEEGDGPKEWQVSVDFPDGEGNDATYMVIIEVEDAAGNETVYRSGYYIVDSTPPTAKIVSTATDGKDGDPTDDSGFYNKKAQWTTETVSNDEKDTKNDGGVIKALWKKLIETFSFTNRYSQQEINTTLYWKDNSDNFIDPYAISEVAYGVYRSGSEKTTDRYTKENFETLRDAENFWTTVEEGVEYVEDGTDEGFYYYEIPAIKAEGNDSKFIVYLRVTDIVGNVIYLSTDGMIVEDELPVSEADGTKPSIAISTPNTNGYNDVHNASVGLTVNVLEKPDFKFSGIKSVTYNVEDKNDESVTVTLNAESPVDESNEDGLIGTRGQKLQLSVPGNYESNGIMIRAMAVDNSGNTNYVEETYNIDNRTPTATISYDNNTAYNNKYFNQPRTASIVVTELNFDASNTTVTTQGSVSGWTVQPNGNTGTNTATVSYTADGDYTLAFQTTDKAGHTMEDGGVVYEGVATQDFTIDMTNPKVEISFRDAEGNTIPSGGYAKSAVTATITVTEHNFDESSATRGLTVTRDGASHPVNLSWSHSGDTHTATLTFDEVEGAEYAFNMSFVDLANNQCDPFTEVGFFVDTKAPTVEVDGIKIDSANKDIADGQISITITDKYYDADQVTLSLRGAANGAVKDFYTAQPAVLLEDGETWSATYVFNHLDKDDIYTLTIKATDKSGNISTKMKVLDSSQETEALKFSLNREGSTYDVDETTRALLDGYYTNKLKDDVIITIVNVDELDLDHDGLGIVVVRDLIESLTLVEGEGYVIDSVEEIPGGYRYTVRIFKEVFAEDGAYSVLVSTKDMAGNSSRNDTAFDEAHEMELQFYLDTKAPIIKLDNLDDGKTYPRNDQDDSAFRDGKYQAALLTVNDQTLDKVIVTIQYKEGPQSYTWTGEDLVMEGSSFTQELSDKYAIAEGLNIAIQVEALDKAGNVMYLSYSENDDGTIEPTDDYTFTVSTNAFIRFYANKGLFFGTIGGILVLAACVTGLVLSRRKKKETARA